MCKEKQDKLLSEKYSFCCINIFTTIKSYILQVYCNSILIIGFIYILNSMMLQSSETKVKSFTVSIFSKVDSADSYYKYKTKKRCYWCHYFKCHYDFTIYIEVAVG